MLDDVQNLVVNDTDGSPQRIAGRHIKEEHTRPAPGDGSATPARGKPTKCLTLRRGPQLLVLFRGYPHRSAVLSLRQARVMIGLALSPDELTMMGRLDGYGYVFVSSRSQAASALAHAVSDLISASWSIDDNTTRPIVARSGRSVTTDDRVASAVPAPVHHACSDAVDQCRNDRSIGFLWQRIRHAAVSERWQARWRSFLESRQIHRD